MDLRIVPVSTETLEDWLAFFDQDAFSDNPEWAGCYCGFYFEADDAVWSTATHAEKREAAIRNIRSGRMTGLLAYVDGKPVGWVNAGDRMNFPRMCAQVGYVEAGSLRLPMDPSSGPIGRGKAIVCYVIRPDMRGRGIASALLDRVVEDAAAEGFDYVEAYPIPNASNCATHYHGPAVMYEKAGFQLVMAVPEVEVWRKFMGGSVPG